jgi:hypothetical protein
MDSIGWLAWLSPALGAATLLLVALAFRRDLVLARHRLRITKVTPANPLASGEQYLVHLRFDVEYQGPGTTLTDNAVWFPKKKKLRAQYDPVESTNNWKLCEYASFTESRPDRRLKGPSDAVTLDLTLKIPKKFSEEVASGTVPGDIKIRHGASKTLSLPYSITFPLA